MFPVHTHIFSNKQVRSANGPRVLLNPHAMRVLSFSGPSGSRLRRTSSHS